MQFVNKKASYKIVAKNTGDIALNDVVVVDTVPSQNKLLAAPGAQIDGNTATGQLAWVLVSPRAST